MRPAVALSGTVKVNFSGIAPGMVTRASSPSHLDGLPDFLDFNDFMQLAEAAVEEHELEGIIQIASFHPQFQCEGTEPDDMGNFTNRAPFPILHLLREASIERAVAAFPEAETIYERNIETLKALGHAGL